MRKSLLVFGMLCLSLFSFAQVSKQQAIATLPQTNSRDNPYWTDIVTERPEGYVELENGDVEISSAEGLAWLISVVNGLNGCIPDNFEGRKVMLINNVDLSGADWIPIGDMFSDSTLVFKGHFDGKGHVIRNLYIKDLFWDYLSLFGYLDHAEIHNIFLDQGLICGRCYCGGIAGRSDNGSIINNCVVNLEVSGLFYTGGLAGHNKNSTIRNCCYINNRFEPADNFGGGIAGQNEADGQNAIIENCYYDSQIIGSFNTCWTGGIVGLNTITGNGGTAWVKNCYAALHGQDWYDEGGIIGRNMGGELSNCYYCIINSNCEIPLVGDGDMNYTECSIFEYQEGGDLVLEHPVSVGDYQTDNLLDALNLWQTIQIPAIQYHNWCKEVSLPFFCDQLSATNEDILLHKKVSLFPNPTDSFVFIEGSSLIKFEVYNLAGKKLHENEGRTIKIDASGWSKGIYLVKIIEENDAVVTKKLVVR